MNKVIRLGLNKTLQDKPRLMLIELEDERKKRILLTHAKGPRECEDWNGVYSSPDLTRKEREEDKRLRDELRSLKKDEKTNYIIRRGKIVERNRYPSTNVSVPVHGDNTEAAKAVVTVPEEIVPTTVPNQTNAQA